MKICQDDAKTGLRDKAIVFGAYIKEINDLKFYFMMQKERKKA